MERQSEAEARRLARMQRCAAALAGDGDFAEILKELKNRAIRNWANGPCVAARESAWHDMQAVALLESALKGLADSRLLDERKAEAAERKEKLASARPPA